MIKGSLVHSKKRNLNQDKIMNEKLDISQVIKKLRDMKLKKGQNLVWVSFPYSKSNLEIIESSIKKISKNKDEYRVSYDDEIIFIEKDSFKLKD